MAAGAEGREHSRKDVVRKRHWKAEGNRRVTPGRMLCESGIGKQKETGEYNRAHDHKRLLSNSGVVNSLLEELQDAPPTGLTNSLA